MKTNDLIKSLGMISPSVMPSRLINEIHAALVERDELRDTSETPPQSLTEYFEAVAIMTKDFANEKQENTRLSQQLETATHHLRAIIDEYDYVQDCPAILAAAEWLGGEETS
jgi:DNA-binding HxlR family transcriptional regulator